MLGLHRQMSNTSSVARALSSRDRSTTFVDWPKEGSPLHFLFNSGFPATPTSTITNGKPSQRPPIPDYAFYPHKSSSSSPSTPGYVDELGRRCTHPAARDAVSFLANAGPSPNRAKFPIHEQGTWFENPAPLPSPRPRKSPTQSTLKVVPKTKAQTQTETVTATSEFEFPPLKSLSPYLLSLMFPPPSLLSPKTLHTNLSATSFIGQKIPSKMLSTTLLSHFNALRSSIFTGKPTLPTQNVMLTGPSGSGKTHIIETYLRQISPYLPFHTTDITGYSGTGYVGGDVSDIVKELHNKCNKPQNIKVKDIIGRSLNLPKGETPREDDLIDAVTRQCGLYAVEPPANITDFLNSEVATNATNDANYGVIYIDEIDKISSYNPHGLQKGVVGTRDVQQNLLKIIEDGEIEIKPPAGGSGNSFVDRIASQQTPSVRTKNILFIFSGAFNDMNEYLTSQYGSVDPPVDINGSYLNKATTETYVKCGFTQEFIGRIPTRVNLHPLTKSDLMDILTLTTSEKSVLRREKESFSSFGLDLQLTDCAVDEIAQKCFDDKTGARGLGGVLEEVTRDFKFELGGQQGEKIAVKIDRDAVRDPSQLLATLI